jgi:hypothetical protein
VQVSLLFDRQLKRGDLYLRTLKTRLVQRAPVMRWSPLRPGPDDASCPRDTPSVKHSRAKGKIPVALRSSLVRAQVTSRQLTSLTFARSPAANCRLFSNHEFRILRSGRRSTRNRPLPQLLGNTAEQSRLKPCAGKPFELSNELELEGSKRKSRLRPFRYRRTPEGGRLFEIQQ